MSGEAFFLGAFLALLVSEGVRGFGRWRKAKADEAAWARYASKPQTIPPPVGEASLLSELAKPPATSMIAPGPRIAEATDLAKRVRARALATIDGIDPASFKKIRTAAKKARGKK